MALCVSAVDKPPFNKEGSNSAKELNKEAVKR
jgi:hypothetical protein